MLAELDYIHYLFLKSIKKVSMELRKCKLLLTKVKSFIE